MADTIGLILAVVVTPAGVHDPDAAESVFGSIRGRFSRLRVLPRRWVVERTFAWLGRCRRLSKDYERTTARSEAFVKLAMMHRMARRLAKNAGRSHSLLALRNGTSRAASRPPGTPAPTLGARIAVRAGPRASR